MKKEASPIVRPARAIAQQQAADRIDIAIDLLTTLPGFTLNKSQMAVVARAVSALTGVRDEIDEKLGLMR